MEKDLKIEKGEKNLVEYNFQNSTLPEVLKERAWYYIDLKNNKALGRIAVKVAELLRGKNKVGFLANFDLGANVVLVNAKLSSFTGNKLEKKFYYDHSGHPGGMRKRSLKIMSKSYSKELVFRVIKGMMPHNKLSRKQQKRLFIYEDEKHRHQAQEKNFIYLEL